MPLFVDPDDVITRMQLDPNLLGTDELVASGIIAAQLHVERIIGGRLQRTDQNSLYHLDSESFSGLTPGGVYRVEVPSGFIRRDETLTITSGSGPRYTTSYADVDPDFMTVDYERGYVLLDAQYADAYVRVQGVTGFEDGTRLVDTEGVPGYSETVVYEVGDQAVYPVEDGEIGEPGKKKGGKATEAPDPKVYECIATDGAPGHLPTDTAFWKVATIPLESVPDAIYDAILSLVPVLLSASQTTNRAVEAEQQYKMLTDHANLLLQPFARTKGFSYRPI